MKVIILPGNGVTNIMNSNYYGWLYNTLRDQYNINCIATVMPDPYEAKRDIWIPYIKNTLQADEDSILIGHSSGAQAALRYTELYPVKGVILVAATYSDLNIEHERLSGYYPLNNETENLYDFKAMKRNCPQWYQFHSTDDCFIPMHEANRIATELDLKIPSEYKIFSDRNHFFQPPFPELIEVIRSFE